MTISVGTRYGGGPTLPRKVISSGLSQTELAVEVYPLRLHLLVISKGDRTTIRISKKVSYELLALVSFAHLIERKRECLFACLHLRFLPSC